MPSLQPLGPYELIDVLGQGGMGTVYRARHRELGVTRALKVLHGLRDPKQRKRFTREVQHLARIQHPNVVAIHEAGPDDGQVYFVMDLVEGESLQTVLDKEERLPYDRALEIALGVAEGVAALHAEGIVHRDLKPANVVLRPDGSPVVLDLGLAVAPELDTRLTITGELVGTPFFMAPEQLHGSGVSTRTDVYALGMILFELTTHSTVFPRGLTLMELQSLLNSDESRSLGRNRAWGLSILAATGRTPGKLLRQAIALAPRSGRLRGELSVVLGRTAVVLAREKGQGEQARELLTEALGHAETGLGLLAGLDGELESTLALHLLDCQRVALLHAIRLGRAERVQELERALRSTRKIGTRFLADLDKEIAQARKDRQLLQRLR